jgi:molecular chaperone GrpE
MDMHDENPPKKQQTRNPGGPLPDSAEQAGNGARSPGATSEAPAQAPEQSASADLSTQLEAALAETAQCKDTLLRALADAENMRKRSSTELSNAHKYAVEGFASNLLAVKDTLEMALADKASTTEQLRMGVDLTLKNLSAAFDKAKVTEVNPLNQKFDPTLHQAVSQVDSDEPANTVVQVFQKGYVLQDRVLRPAMVAVAKPKSAQQLQTESPVESGGN